MYTIVSGDTLLVIAARFGLTLDELLAANPEVDPYLLSVGAELIIPQSGEEGGLASLGFPTPLPFSQNPHRTAIPRPLEGCGAFGSYATTTTPP